MYTIAALFVDPKGPYVDYDFVDVWDEKRDARLYNGQNPVVCHPPCGRWGKLAPVNFKRWGAKIGEDGGCFESALRSVRRCGGVLEHPAQTLAWPHFGLNKPVGDTWNKVSDNEWVCEVWQSDYGHLATKRTWLYYVGSTKPIPFSNQRKKGQYQVGGGIHTGNNKKPRLPQGLSHLTPKLFSDYLISLAENSTYEWSK